MHGCIDGWNLPVSSDDPVLSSGIGLFPHTVVCHPHKTITHAHLRNEDKGAQCDPDFSFPKDTS